MAITSEQLQSGETFYHPEFKGFFYRVSNDMKLFRRYREDPEYFLGNLSFLRNEEIDGIAVFYCVIFGKVESISVSLSNLEMCKP